MNLMMVRILYVTCLNVREVETESPIYWFPSPNAQELVTQVTNMDGGAQFIELLLAASCHMNQQEPRIGHAAKSQSQAL